MADSPDACLAACDAPPPEVEEALASFLKTDVGPWEAPFTCPIFLPRASIEVRRVSRTSPKSHKVYFSASPRKMLRSPCTKIL
jgi:hypothetical protein